MKAIATWDPAAGDLFFRALKEKLEEQLLKEVYLGGQEGMLAAISHCCAMMLNRWSPLAEQQVADKLALVPFDHLIQNLCRLPSAQDQSPTFRLNIAFQGGQRMM